MPTRAELKPSAPHPVTVGLMWTGSLVKASSQPSSVTVVSPLPNKKTISHDRSSSCENGSHKPRSSLTSGADSTSNAKDCSPYWDDFCAGTSLRLWSPTETVLHDLGSNSSNTSALKTVENSWFSTARYTAPRQNSPRIFLQSFMCSPAVCTGFENTAVRSRKIRIYPTAAQKAEYRRWFGTARKVYNDTIKYLEEPGTTACWKGIKGNILAALPEWAKEIPYQIKSMAVKDACSAVSAAKKKCLTGQGFQSCKWKTRKNPKQSCYIPKSSVTKDGIYPRLTKEMVYAEPIKDEHGDCRLVCENDRWFISMP